MRGERLPFFCPPLYAALAPAGDPAGERLAWTVASELATMLARGEPHDEEEQEDRRRRRRRVLLVDAEGHIKGTAAAAAGSHDETPLLMHDRLRGLHVLAYPGRLVEANGGGAAGERSPDEEAAAAALVRRTLMRHGQHFDVLVACCAGEGAYGARWLSGADGVVVLCGPAGEGLDDALRTARELRRGDGGTVLAPAMDPDEPPPDLSGHAAGHPAYPLPAVADGHSAEGPEDHDGTARRRRSLALRELLAGLMAEADAAAGALAGTSDDEIEASPEGEEGPRGDRPEGPEEDAPESGPLEPAMGPPTAARAEPVPSDERFDGPVRERVARTAPAPPAARPGPGGSSRGRGRSRTRDRGTPGGRSGPYRGGLRRA